MLITLLIACVLLGIIFLQDIRTRSIWWFLPPLLFVTFLIDRWETLSLIGIAFNITFIVCLMAFLTVYIRFRFGKLQNPFKEYFGLGDFLFILAITPLLSFQQFIYFFTAGTLITLLIHGGTLLFKKQTTIPYAGYFSLVTMSYVILRYCKTDVFQFFQV